MNNFKAGDLALIVGAYKCKENIGKAVIVSHMIDSQGRSPNGRPVLMNIPCYVVYGEGLTISVWHGDQFMFTQQSEYTICRPCDLMPLRGDFTHSKEKQEEQPA